MNKMFFINYSLNKMARQRDDKDDKFHINYFINKMTRQRDDKNDDDKLHINYSYNKMASRDNASKSTRQQPQTMLNKFKSSLMKMTSKIKNAMPAALRAAARGANSGASSSTCGYLPVQNSSMP
jgi:hypothetical protein